jgi:phage shock protein A
MAKRDGAAAAVQKKWWQFWTKTNMQIDANADPEVLMRRAVSELHDQSRNLEQNAAKVISAHQQALMDLNDLLVKDAESERRLEQAVTLMDREQDPTKREQLLKAANTLAEEQDSLDRQIAAQQTLVDKAEGAVMQVRAAVEQNRRDLKTAEGTVKELKAANAQAAAQESMNSAMAAINDTIGDGVNPTLAQVRQRINERYTTATAITQLRQDPARDAIAAIDAAVASSSANDRIAAIRAKQAGQLPAPAAPLPIEATSTDTTIVAARTETPAGAKPFDPSAFKK